MYYQARYYDAALGRFTQPDTIIPNPHNPQALNRYSYVYNNPLRYKDPSGKTPWDVVDVFFWAWSVKDFITQPSWENAGWLALDTAGLLPIVPSIGAVRRGVQGVSAAQKIETVEKVGKLGRWVERAEHMSQRAREYQEFVTGVTDKVYELKGVRFDAFKDGVLIDAKGFYKQFIDPETGQFFGWFDGAGKLLEQARNQIKVADGAPIQWHFNEMEALEAVRKLFETERIEGIELIFRPMQ